ncbi:lytic transglycosylase F [Candidatus Endobugula sertula]|uniref:Membrane-bound lytic murein transglycosylase F n=1 Tax=Candidatus Endobugula sertula TaxID=62101 RepID=A0A1D2QSX7_9GAMM|nr:lytic transglycosylase F [Candidatus Endobugula sertula]
MDKPETTEPTPNTEKHYTASAQTRLVGTVFLCLMPFMFSSSTPPSLLEKIQQDGLLQVVSFNGPSTYYEDRFGHTGFEYELARAFADTLGVELTIKDERGLQNILESISEAKGHFAAAGLSIADERQQSIRFSIPYSNTTQQVIYRRGNPKPKTIDDLLGKNIIVISQSSHANTLTKLKKHYPELSWEEKDNIEMTDLLSMVHNGNADIALVDSTVYITNQTIYPKARKAFNIAEPESIAWAFPKRIDNSLFNAANAFLRSYINNGKLTELKKKYFHKPPINESSALILVQRIKERLPQWIGYFRQIALKYDMDWLFLAAISYQESLWNKDAKSYTGVRGLMMLTHKTARELSIKDRTDPEQSIDGGARYFLHIHKRISQNIKEPNRTWMALAAYNVGLGHLEDARVLTKNHGGNPNIWEDVKKNLPLLANKKYYRTTKHGYARGWEPVRYVANIRNYHNILIWYYENKQRQLTFGLKKQEVIETPIFKASSLPHL